MNIIKKLLDEELGTEVIDKDELIDIIKDLLEEDEEEVTVDEKLLLDGLLYMLEEMAAIPNHVLEYVLDTLDRYVGEDEEMDNELITGEGIVDVDMDDGDQIEEAAVKQMIRGGKKVRRKPGYVKRGGKFQKIKPSTKRKLKIAARKKKNKKIKASVKAKMKRSKKKTLRKFGKFIQRNKR